MSVFACLLPSDRSFEKAPFFLNSDSLLPSIKRAPDFWKRQETGRPNLNSGSQHSRHAIHSVPSLASSSSFRGRQADRARLPDKASWHWRPCWTITRIFGKACLLGFFSAPGHGLPPTPVASASRQTSLARAHPSRRVCRDHSSQAQPPSPLPEASAHFCKFLGECIS